MVLAHLRSVKDPLLTARAARLLDPGSRVTVHHAGRAFDRGWEEAALEEAQANPRYHWHRELDRTAALDLLASGHVLACTSLTEGGANVVTEAIALGVPGHRHPYRRQTPGWSATITPDWCRSATSRRWPELLSRLETDANLMAELQRRTDELESITDPATERETLAAVLASL